MFNTMGNMAVIGNTHYTKCQYRSMTIDGGKIANHFNSCIALSLLRFLHETAGCRGGSISKTAGLQAAASEPRPRLVGDF
jgi:hypothetical protein